MFFFFTIKQNNLKSAKWKFEGACVLHLYTTIHAVLVLQNFAKLH